MRWIDSCIELFYKLIWNVSLANLNSVFFFVTNSLCKPCVNDCSEKDKSKCAGIQQALRKIVVIVLAFFISAEY